MEPSVGSVGVIDKSMSIIEAIAEQPRTLGQLVEATGLNRATTHRLAQALVGHGLLRRNDGRFDLGFRWLEYGSRLDQADPLREHAAPVLEDLRTETGESAQLYVRDGDERICLAAAESPHGLRTIVPVGRRLTMARGSAARVLASDAPAVEAPVAVGSVADREPGVASVSAPVRDRAGVVVAAVSVSGPIERTGTDPVDQYGEAVLAAAHRLESVMGWA